MYRETPLSFLLCLSFTLKVFVESLIKNMEGFALFIFCNLRDVLQKKCNKQLLQWHICHSAMFIVPTISINLFVCRLASAASTENKDKEEGGEYLVKRVE